MTNFTHLKNNAFIGLCFIAIFSICSCKNISKTPKYNLYTQKGWSDYGADVTKEFDKNSNINMIQATFDTAGIVLIALTDCQNTSAKFSSYLKRKQYSKTTAGYSWTLFEGTDLYIKGDDDKVVKDIAPFVIPIAEANFSDIGKAVEKIIASKKGNKLLQLTINFYKDPKERFMEANWLNNDGKGLEQYLMDGTLYEGEEKETETNDTKPTEEETN